MQFVAFLTPVFGTYFLEMQPSHRICCFSINLFLRLPIEIRLLGDKVISNF